YRQVSSSAGDSFFQLRFETHRSDQSMKIVRMHTQLLSRLHITSVGLRNRGENQLPLGLEQSPMVSRLRRIRRRNRLKYCLGQILGTDEFRFSENNRVLNRILELAHVARPTVIEQAGLRSFRQTAHGSRTSGRMLGSEVSGQQWNVAL